MFPAISLYPSHVIPHGPSWISKLGNTVTLRPKKTILFFSPFFNCDHVQFGHIGIFILFDIFHILMMIGKKYREKLQWLWKRRSQKFAFELSLWINVIIKIVWNHNELSVTTNYLENPIHCICKIWEKGCAEVFISRKLVLSTMCEPCTILSQESSFRSWQYHWSQEKQICWSVFVGRESSLKKK